MIDILKSLGEVEIELVRKFAQRLLYGQRTYGKFEGRLEKNENLVKEILEEVLDAQVYCQRLLNIIDNYDIVVKLKEGGNNEPESNDCDVKETLGCCEGTVCGWRDCGRCGYGEEGYSVAGMLVVGDENTASDDGENCENGGEADRPCPGINAFDDAMRGRQSARSSFRAKRFVSRSHP